MRSIEGTPRCRNGKWSSSTADCVPVREHGRRADAPRGRPQPPPERGIGEAFSRQREISIGDEVEQDHRLGVLVPRRSHLAPAQARLQEAAGRVRRRLLAVEEDEDDRRAKLPRLDRPRELDDERRAARAVVRADEAGQVLRVVVRSDDDRARGIAAGHEADDVAQAAGHGLEPSVGQLGLQLCRELPRGRRSGRPRPEAHLAHEPRPGRLFVHAIDGRRGGRSDEYERGQRRYGP